MGSWFDFEAAYSELDPMIKGKINSKEFTEFFRKNEVNPDLLSDQDILEIYYELLS